MALKHTLAAFLVGLALLVTSGAAGFAQSKDAANVATLYRSSVVIGNARIHVATFNTGGNKFSYNWENCVLAARLFQAQPGVRTRFWCEKGFYRK